MSGLSVNIGSDIAKMSQTLSRYEQRVSTAISQGLNEGGDLVRTQVRRSMQKQTGLTKLASVTKRQRTLRAFGASPSYTIVFSSKPNTKASEFRSRVSTGPGGGVTVWLWNTAHKFKRSFQEKIKGGLRMRIGDPRLPIRGFDGPNLAKEAVKDDVAKTFLVGSAAIVPTVIMKRLARM
jgi:hypothetical protein